MQDLRSQLEDLISGWRRGVISGSDLLEQAEELWEGEDGLPTLPETDSGSIEIEVIGHLSMLNVQLICKQDIETILQFLRTPRGDECSAWRRWRQYWDNIDYTKRARDLRDKDLYLVAQYLED